MGDQLPQPGLPAVAERLRRALRQEERVQIAHQAVLDERARIGHSSGWHPPSLQALEDQWSDECYFLLVAARQAVSARAAFVTKGHQSPEIRQASWIAEWRNVLEHWDEPIYDKPIRALARMAAMSDQPGPGTSHLYNDDGLLYLAGVSLVNLRDDLSAVLRCVDDAIAQRFDHDWLDEEQAAEFIGLAAVPTSSPCHGLNFMTFPDVGRRYYRVWLSDWLDCMQRVEAAEPPLDAPPSGSGQDCS